MSTKQNKAELTSESTPIKQLVLRREKVRDLGVRSGVNTGALIYGRNPGSGVAGSGSAVQSFSVVSHIIGTSGGG